MMNLMRGLIGLVAALAAGLSALVAMAAEQVTLGTDWRAQAEHGGYYQAVATGLYAKAGLEVEIRPHAGAGHDSLAQLKDERIMISPDTRIGFWRFLKAKYGYSDDQIAPYTFNLAPFLADPMAIQQGLLSSEPFQIERAGKKPVVMLLADAGYASYSSIIMTSTKRAQEQPDLVRRFVDASIAGWVSYLTGDPSPANALIKKDNPDMTDDLLAFGRGKLIEHGMILSGDANARGVGMMTEERWRAFFEVMAADGLYPRSMDFRKAYTTAFVGKPGHRAGGGR
jgi:NitT/TauT family transport system substrate-binding protein